MPQVPRLLLVPVPVLLMLNAIVSTLFMSLKLSQLYNNWLCEIQQSTPDLENQVSDEVPTIVPSKRTSSESVSTINKDHQFLLAPRLQTTEVTKKISEKTLVNEYPQISSTEPQINVYNYTAASDLTSPQIPSINFDSNKSTLVGTSNSNSIQTQHISYQSANFLFAPNTDMTPLSDKTLLASEPFRPVQYSPSQLTVSSSLPKTRRKLEVDKIPSELMSPKRAPIVHKSKSTSIISAADAARTEEKKLLISNEKELLSNINESLLPPLLQQGESPILERQRQQKEHELQALQRRQSQNQISRVERPNKFARSKSFTEKRTLPPTDLSRILESHNVSDSDSAQLSYIEEFSAGSSLDQTAFASFDGAYTNKAEPMILEENISREHGSPSMNKAKSSLKGLENVQGYPQWDPTALANKTFEGNVNHISLGDWLQNSEQWEQRKVSSGVRIASFPTKVLDASVEQKVPTTFTYDELMLDDGQRNITNYFQRSSYANDYRHNESFDKIFDVTIGLDQDSIAGETVKVELKHPENNVLRSTILERSASAPSLHTFRKPSEPTESSRTSSGTRYSEMEVDLSLKLAAVDIVDPQEENEPETPKPSPIKKFFQESPRKLSSVFKRNSRTSFDGSFMYPRHKHTGSTVSNQFSMNSAASSRSSPKKSLKSMLTYKALLQKEGRADISRRNSQTQGLKQSVFSMHQSHNSVPNFSSFHLDSGMVDHYYTKLSAPGFSTDRLEAWDIHTVQDSDNSRVSSVPSAVIGQYDREKWRTLKELETTNSQFNSSRRLST